MCAIFVIKGFGLGIGGVSDDRCKVPLAAFSRVGVLCSQGNEFGGRFSEWENETSTVLSIHSGF